MPPLNPDAGSRRISVITAVSPGHSEFLAETANSINAQELPDGWTIDWCVQIDGAGSVPRPAVAPQVSLRIATSDVRRGPAVARNLALDRAGGELVKVLDADDQLTPGQLSRELAVFEANPATVWVVSRAVDLLPDGTTTGSPDDPQRGRLELRSVREHWLAHDHRLPVHPATLCMRREAVDLLGGWMLLPASEDTALLLSLDALWPGYFLADVGLLYRKWPRQLTAQESHSDEDSRRERFTAILARLSELDRRGP